MITRDPKEDLKVNFEILRKKNHFCKVSWGAFFISCLLIVNFTQGENELIIFNDNGGWCWYQDERVIIHDNTLIIGSVADDAGTGGSSRSGNIEVTSYDLDTSTILGTSVLHANLQGDDHAAPAFLVRTDEKIIALYSKHGNDNYIRYRISTYAGDATSWQSEQLETRGAGVTYSNVFRLDAENSGAGRTYDFYRGEDWNPNYVYSDDDGDSWIYGGQVITFSGRPYVKYASNNYDEIHFITTEAHPRDYNNSIYHGYIKNGNVYESDGTFIKSLASGPIAPTQATLVFAGDVNNVAWTTDIHLDENGHPYIGFSVQKNQSQYDLRYHYARWDGAQWHDHEIAYAGTALYSSEQDYTGLIALDPQDPEIVYISADAHPVTGAPLISAADGQRHYEIFRGQTEDYGASWMWVPITMDSDLDNIRPVVPRGDSLPTVLLWMQGTYYSYTSFDTDIVGIVDPQPLFDYLTCEQVIALGYQLDSDISGPDGMPDCYVNFHDLAAMGGEWLNCTNPIVGDINGPAGEPDGCVDLHDFAPLAAEWLTCIDPQEETGSCFNPFE